VNKAIHRAGGEADYWKIYPFLPTETRGYVPAFIAVNYAMQYYCDHHITPMQTQYPIATDTVIIDKMLHFQQVADLCNINIDALRALNPQYKKDIIPGNVKPYALRLPQETLLTFIDLEDSVYLHRSDELLKRRTKVDIPKETATPSGSKPKTIRVRKGENLGSIAAKYKTTVAKLRKLNGLNNNNIRAGQKLRIR
jgi:membrane-bound lytic murein transglycosylase D